MLLIAFKKIINNCYWEEKTGRRVPDDISDNPRVKYGTNAEKPLVELFALDYPQYRVRVNKNVIYKRGFMFASLDGELTEKATKLRGVYEGKTTEIHSKTEMEIRRYSGALIYRSIFRVI